MFYVHNSGGGIHGFPGQGPQQRMKAKLIFITCCGEDVVWRGVAWPAERALLILCPMSLIANMVISNMILEMTSQARIIA
jgi:hypothetical protein